MIKHKRASAEAIRKKTYRANKTISLTLKSFGCYQISKMGVHFYTKRGFKLFVPKSIMKRLEGMIV